MINRFYNTFRFSFVLKLEFEPPGFRRKPVRQTTLPLALIVASMMMASVTFAQEASRIWVDSTGLHSIQAMLVEVNDTDIRLLRDNGEEILMQLDQLSKDDHRYVEEYQNQVQERNGLRTKTPSPPKIRPLKPLRLRPAASEAVPDSQLTLGPALRHPNRHVSKSSRASVMAELPKSLPADRSPVSLGCPPTVIPIHDLDFNDHVSRPIAVQTTSNANARRTSIAFSISRPAPLESVATRNQILRCDFSDHHPMVVMQHDRSLRLLDHDHVSGNSLILLDSGPVGEGGFLSSATGWDVGNLNVTQRRTLPESKESAPWLSSSGSSQILSPMKLSWARWVDDQHAIAKVDQSIVLWNLVSGEPLYRIDRIDSRSTPALSGGKRYLAVPRDGMVDLHETRTGKHLGRIRVERQLPAVSFSPYGNALAIVTTRRVRVWDLPAASLAQDVQIREGLGSEPPVWIDHDLLLSGSGVLVSLFRGLPVWKYDVTGCQISKLGKHVAILRKVPLPQLTTVKIPHDQAKQMIQRMDASLMKSAGSKRQILGRSRWDGQQWVDREVRLGALPSRTR